MTEKQPVGSVAVAREADGGWYVFVQVAGLYEGRLTRIGPAPNEDEARVYARHLAEHIAQQFGPGGHAEVAFDERWPRA